MSAAPSVAGGAGRAVGLAGKVGLVVGIANEHSIAWGCARAFRDAGATLAVSYLNEKAEPYVRPLAASIDCPVILPCDVERPGEMEALFAAVERQWGRLDFLLHAVAFAPLADLHGRLVDCSAEGFARAMDISCHSFLRMARLAEPLMTEGGAMLTVSYYGAEKAVPNYGLMGPVKSALESAVRYLAQELGGRRIAVNAISPGPIATRAASGIAEFTGLMAEAEERSAEHRLVSIDDVGALAAFLASERARAITGNVSYVDAGYHVAG